ncbi:MAG: biotin/lipoyl-binding protein, partial [Muribaculaceae bacterium]|nr:biotin/lipoyl-binding protein [Muribaculaceae bacterium]
MKINHFRFKNPRRVVILVAVLLALAAVITLVCVILRPKAAPAQPPTVIVEKVKTSNVNVYGDYVGRIRAQQFVEIRARVEGYLEQMLFEEGTHIEKGQTLFIIDRKLYKARAEKARSQLSKAKAQAHKAKRDLERIQPLYEQNA